jgi:hypothetical protein
MLSELFTLISQNRDDANVVAAIASAVTASISFVVAALSLWIAFFAYRHQRRHDVMTLKPLIEITVGDWETRLRITLRNNGAGPLIVRMLVTGDGSEVRSSIISWMPDLPSDLSWATFTGSVDGRSISPDKSITLLELEGDDEDLEFCRFRDEVRRALSQLTVNVEYTDVYDTYIAPYRKRLDWFGRMLES